VDTRGHVSFTAAASRFRGSGRIHVESADSGRTWTQQALPPTANDELYETPSARSFRGEARLIPVTSPRSGSFP